MKDAREDDSQGTREPCSPQVLRSPNCILFTKCWQMPNVQTVGVSLSSFPGIPLQSTGARNSVCLGADVTTDGIRLVPLAGEQRQRPESLGD